ncbi:hypothetical protein F383_23906 [Gossypium arboreum]|uniref:Uncharacterized protein n=1 Tax=Gossypium arboreum TaxID=29729 RepID=A0A0B0P3E3_GOSAR|nr:hypothetical protein F383_23906 [Gossypium arboreum]
MYEIREWKMDHSKGYPMPRLSRLWDIPWRDIPVWGLSVRGLGLGFEA